MEKQDTTIRLLHPWRGRLANMIIPGLSLIVAEALVRRRIAEWAPGRANDGTPLGQEPRVQPAPAAAVEKSVITQPQLQPSKRSKR
jgi:hypothetical protein